MAPRNRPVDLAHLSRQTFGDRAVEQEVLSLFVHQANAFRDHIVTADRQERLRLAHGLKGSARGVGAFAIADCLAEFEENPQSETLIKRLARVIDETTAFIASISR